MYVERYGHGARCILGLHGWSGDHTTFDPLARCLPSEVSLYAPDLPGCGRTPPPSRWRLSAVADYIATLLEELSSGGLILAGNCSGGLLGLCAVLRLMAPGTRPEIERIVLIDPLAYWPWYFRLFASEPAGRYAYRGAFGNPVGRRMVNLCRASRRQKQTNLTEGFEAVPPEVARAYLRVFGEIRAPGQFAMIRTPITLLYGERTFKAVRRSVAIYRGIWPQTEVIEIRGAGHLPLAEAPAAVASLLLGRNLCQTA